ncbi:MAG: DUF2786 domain-containing protein, partial [Actinomycetota bacterium]
MGKDNKKRLAEKRRKQAKRRAAAASAGRTSSRTSQRQAQRGPTDPVAMFWAGLEAHDAGQVAEAEHWVELLAREPVDGWAAELDGLVDAQLRQAWEAGWQPEVLHHVVRRELGAGSARALVDAIAAQAAGYEVLGRQVAPEWMAQLDLIGAQRWWSTQRTRFVQVTEPWADQLGVIVGLVSVLERLPVLPVLGPPPSSWRAGDTHRGDEVSSEVLRRVRSLLAKAESSNFDAEAETFTAKAQELMARHRIDRALLEAEAPTSAGGVAGRLIVHDDPYAESKALLLSTVCVRNGGHAVFTKGLGFSTVFASAVELDMIEDLYTSLLVQATAALQREGAGADPRGRRRTARFRRAFVAG